MITSSSNNGIIHNFNNIWKYQEQIVSEQDNDNLAYQKNQSFFKPVGSELE